ncbi:CPBP family intramembrane glutamic endopeptidase [Enemella evansiae]|uniref:CAAX prenyl protease 2/Lysostaphin resistance protein A-like domain-containing protein n=1 Tax=Enemella evansiae TaxID=2016499 RepID=A0A255GLT7_9ACTN|nr:CPBP family intramembrane glutamic endopeptidase [Enemella evansiae]OYO15872.1 hypothetical protein BI335_11850 [Enemella evansiae]OYO16797.1 hypothetical protein CGZ94_03990 [Enemella evansiae]TDO94320.1 hypothetical protein C8D81_0092 [Enemella evansiae]
MPAIIETPNPSETNASTKKPRLPGWLRAVLVPVLFMATVMVVQLGYSAIPGVTAAMSDPNNLLLVVLSNLGGALLVTVAVLGVIALLMRLVDRAPLRRIGLVWTRHSLPALGLGLLIVVVIGQLVMWGGLLVGQTQRVTLPPDLLSTGMIAATIALALIRAFLLQGIPEELFFRGYLMQALAERPRVAALASAGLFAVIHLVSKGGQQNLVDRLLYLLIPLGFGFLAAALMLRTRSIWSAVGVHAGFHVSNLIGQFSGLAPEGRYFWVVTGLVLLLAGFVVLRGYRGDRVIIDR